MSFIILLSLLIGIDSPVNIDSSTVKLWDSIILISADILSPDSKQTKSPGTNSFISISISLLFLITLTFNGTSSCNESIVLLALFSS